MVIEHKLNVELSREVYNECETRIQPKMCYNNVFNVLTFGFGYKFISGDWKVAYGYVHVMRNLFARHCFIVDNDGQAIDPTIVGLDSFDEDEPKQYISFVTLSLKEYLGKISMHDNQPALYNVFMDEEIMANQWASERNMVIGG